MHPDQARQWNYLDGDALGPREWPKYFQAGDSQSPINIIVDHCTLRLHSSSTGPVSTDEQRLSERLARKLVLGARGGHRDHLDSTGGEADERYSPDSYDGDVHRSPSASSNNSNESNTSSEQMTTRHKSDHHHNNHQRFVDHHSDHTHQHHNHHHHNHRGHQQDDRARRNYDQRSSRENQTASQAQNTRYCSTNKKIFLGYPRYLNSVKLSNTGHGWQIDMPPELACHTLLTGPPLGDREYRLAQFHCHWGEDCEHGSEHQVNGQQFSAEIHFVHWNCKQYKSMEEASRNKHGLAVLGVFLQALDGEQNRNKHLDKIISGIREIRDRPEGSTMLHDMRLDLKKLFPSNRWNYATYEGSLTTPPLSESVDWLVFLQPVICSSSQIEHFRRIRCPSGELTKNCRPVQPVNKRTVTIWTHHSESGGGSGR